MVSFSKIVAGTTGTEQDQKLVAYLDFLAQKIRIDKITHLHVIKMLYDFGETHKIINEDLQYIANSYKEERLAPLLERYKNVSTLSATVLTGKVLTRMEETVAAEKATVVALSKKEKGSCTLAKNIIRKLDCSTLIVPENSEHTFTHVLVPVDLSEHSGKLLDSAIAIQKQSTEAVFITCMHAYEVLDIPAYMILRTADHVRRDTKATVQEAFNKFIKKHQTADSNITSVLIEEANSWPSQYILKYINDEDNAIDFVIMGTQGHTLLEALLGSTVEKVISKNDKCPMLIIK